MTFKNEMMQFAQKHDDYNYIRAVLNSGGMEYEAVARGQFSDSRASNLP